MKVLELKVHEENKDVQNVPFVCSSEGWSVRVAPEVVERVEGMSEDVLTEVLAGGMNVEQAAVRDRVRGMVVSAEVLDYYEDVKDDPFLWPNYVGA